MRYVLVLLFAFAIIFAIHETKPISVQSQQNPNLTVRDLSLLVNGNPTIALDSPGSVIVIDATLESQFATASGFNVTIQYRLDSEQSFRSQNLCTSVGNSSTCNNLSVNANNPVTVRGFLVTDQSFSTGRYIIRVSIVPNNVQQTTTDDDFVETILLIGVNNPEFHPVSLSFSPPSPISVGSQVTVRAEIENTGRPVSPQLEVAFEYCLRTSSACTDADFDTTGFTLGTNGVRTLGTAETAALSTGGLLTVTNVLNTSGFAQGRYEFRVSVTAIGQQELDPNNNEISTLLTLGGVSVAGAVCQLDGEITTLGSSVGKLALEDGSMSNVNLLYVVTVNSANLAQLHALNEDELQDVAPSDNCPEIAGSPTPLGTNVDVTTFTIDEQSRLLYVGLNTGNMRVINTERADQLVAVDRFVTGSPLLSFSARVANQSMGQVFIGTDNNQIMRVTVTKADDGGLSVSTASPCISATGNDVKNVQIFAGNTYYTSGTTVFRFDETQCNSSTLRQVFSGDAEIQSLQIGRIQFGNFLSTRIVVGLENGKVHVLTNTGVNLSGSPIQLGNTITAMAINDGTGARSRNSESVFVGTVNGIVSNISLRTLATCDEPFELDSAQQINVLGAYEPDRNATDFGGVTGWVFAGTEGSQLFTISDNCALVDTENDGQPSAANPITTNGPIRSNLLVQDIPSDLSTNAGSVRVTFGGGSGLFIETIGIPFN